MEELGPKKKAVRLQEKGRQEGGRGAGKGVKEDDFKNVLFKRRRE